MSHGPYLTNDAGDVYARIVDGAAHPIEPESFGWTGPQGKAIPDLRRSLEQVAALPGFHVSVEPCDAFVPGPNPKQRGDRWLKWEPEAAPPAAGLSRGGDNGTRAYFDRLSDALGRTVERLLPHPECGPFLVYDFVGGRLIRVIYDPPPLIPGGPGTVYVLDDGDAIKIGHTEKQVAIRVASLQTGNPRVIRTIATIAGASSDVETHLHNEFAQWNRRGEWFDRDKLHGFAATAGGWELLLRRHLSAANWQITTWPAD
jgi:hypothetical protein